MRHIRFSHVLIILLVGISAGFFVLQQVLYNNFEETGFLFFQDLIFLPLNVLLVTFILDRVLQAREKRERLDQMHIVIGAFFSEVGIQALRKLNENMFNTDDIESIVAMESNWSDKNFENAAKKLKAYPYQIKEDKTALESLKQALPIKKEYLIAMFNNPNLLEHNKFTEMLWALYHLIDELENRPEMSSLPQTDIHHLSGDIVRCYRLLVYEWVFYMKHLKNKYPYLWSLAVRKNPFIKNPSIIITT